eukprot:2880416-Pleurochrysis_carterae.AAC.3
MHQKSTLASVPDLNSQTIAQRAIANGKERSRRDLLDESNRISEQTVTGDTICKNKGPSRVRIRVTVHHITFATHNVKVPRCIAIRMSGFIRTHSHERGAPPRKRVYAGQLSHSQINRLHM